MDVLRIHCPVESGQFLSNDFDLLFERLARIEGGFLRREVNM